MNRFLPKNKPWRVLWEAVTGLGTYIAIMNGLRTTLYTEGRYWCKMIRRNRRKFAVCARIKNHALSAPVLCTPDRIKA